LKQLPYHDLEQAKVQCANVHVRQACCAFGIV